MEYLTQVVPYLAIIFLFMVILFPKGVKHILLLEGGDTVIDIVMCLIVWVFTISFTSSIAFLAGMLYAALFIV